MVFVTVSKHNTSDFVLILFDISKIRDNEVNTDAEGVGHTVKVKNLTLNMDQTITIVGANETDPKNMKISSDSPIGEALLGKKKGETFEVEVPMGLMKMQVLEISR